MKPNFHLTPIIEYHIPEELGRIRNATQSDMALGNGRFKEEIEALTQLLKEEIEALTGRRVTPRKRGRKPSQMD